jgi:hypothetical protein
MLPFATELACQVHDWNSDAVEEILRPLNAEGKDALIIALAALVPVGQPLGDLTAWSHEAKKCANCGLRKSFEEFNRASASSDGRQSWCRSCRNGSRRRPVAEVLELDKQRQAS